MTDKIAGYNRAQIILHWLTAVLVIASFVTHEGMKTAWRAVSRGQTDPGSGQLHIYIGIAALAMVLLRLALRYLRGAPEQPEGSGALIRLAGTLTHWALYGLLVLVPVTGLWAWYIGSRDAGDIHETLFNGLWVLVALHTLAALYHHYVVRDGLLRRMLSAG